MVSRRNFLSIIVMMVVLLFMFQFSQVIKENDSDYDINAYALEEIVPNAPIWQADARQGNDNSGNGSQGNVNSGKGNQGNSAPDDAAPGGKTRISTYQGNFVVFCGSEQGDVYKVVEQWCIYTKRGLVVYENPGDYRTEKGNLPEAFLVDSTDIDLSKSISTFSKMTDLGVTLIFCNLPDAASVKRNVQLCALLGIEQVPSEQIEVEGMHLFPGFLLGGEIWYMTPREEDKKNQDLNLNIPWYITAGGTKTYMVGILEELLAEEEAKNEYFPPLIWRNSYGQSKVFVVNGDYLSDMTGLGILDAMMYEADSYVVYPIINAQNALVTNYPEFAGENDGVMMELYSRQMESVQRDICWPDLATLIERNKLKLTCMFAPQYNYLDEMEPSGKTVPFYLQQLKETEAEAGMSLTYGEGVTLEEKLTRDEEFYTSIQNRYLYTSAFVEQDNFHQMEGALTNTALLENIRTVASDFSRKEPVISWYEAAGDGTSNGGTSGSNGGTDSSNGGIDDGRDGVNGGSTEGNDAQNSNRMITLQSVTSDVKTHTYSNDLFVRSMETALGYSNVRIDMHDVLWPQSAEDQWENMYDSMASNLNTYWKAFANFAQTTLTESDRRIRTFLNLDYRDRREEDCVYLEIYGSEESWFLLRVHGEEIASISGAEYREIENGTYLLHVTGGQAEIYLRKNQGLLEYTYP